MSESHVKLRILLIGAHPDDCEGCAGGYAAHMAQRGHDVCLLSMTDGGAGHYELSSHQLIPIRAKEAQAAADLIGAESMILPNADGSLINDLATRKQLIRTIREYQPDLIMTHRPNDYHADHRNTSLLVQDASYLLRVPGFAPETPALGYEPYVMFFRDNFKKPPFQADVVISIDETYETKMKMMACHRSQYFDWLPWIDGILDQVPESEEEQDKWLSERRGRRNTTNEYREQLQARYGDEGVAVEYCEAFEASEYGAQLDDEAIAKLFPM